MKMVFYRVVSHQDGVLYDGLSSGWCFTGWFLLRVSFIRDPTV